MSTDDSNQEEVDSVIDIDAVKVREYTQTATSIHRQEMAPDHGIKLVCMLAPVVCFEHLLTLPSLVQVIVRVRPANETEMSTGAPNVLLDVWQMPPMLSNPSLQRVCIQVHPSNRAPQLSLHPRCPAAAGHYECLGSVGTTQLQVSLKDQDTRQFTYDQVLEESTSQEKVFEGGHMMRRLPGSPGADAAPAPALAFHDEVPGSPGAHGAAAAAPESADLAAASVPTGHL